MYPAPPGRHGITGKEGYAAPDIQQNHQEGEGGPAGKAFNGSDLCFSGSFLRCGFFRFRFRFRPIHHGAHAAVDGLA